MEIKFNVYKGIIDDNGVVESLNKYYDIFSRKWNGNDITFTFGSKSQSGYSITDLKEIEQKYILLTIYHGKLYPIPAKIYNINDSTERENDRKENEIEAEKTYIFMDFTKNLVFLPNNRLERSTYERMMNKLFETEKINLTLKSYGDSNFFDKITAIKSFSFKLTKPTIFADESSKDLMNILVSDINDFGADDITIKIGFKNNQGPIQKIKKIVDKLKSIDSPVTSETVSIIGYDQKNFETIFNKDEYNKRILIDVEVDEKLNIQDDEVARKIISEVNRLDV